MRKQFLLLIAALLISVNFISTESVIAQPISTNINELTDEQIQRIIDEIKDRGLTNEQAIQLAKAKGLSQQQIEQLTVRINKANTPDFTQEQLPTIKSPTASEIKKGSLSRDDKRTDVTDATEYNRKIFGFHLFNNRNLTFEPSVNIPVPSDYAVGIGDEILIQVWGASQQTYTLRVNNNGDIIVPDLGPIKVAGINFKEVEALILKRLSAIYMDMTSNVPSTFASITINNIRSITVNVIGEALTPGTYTLPSTASAFNALYLSGGPNEIGSFREIKVIRNNKTFATVDVYDYLINGVASSNISLRDQDIIYIPPFNKRVETTGAFKRNAIYELRENETIYDLMRYSGGFSEQALKSRLYIKRYTDDQQELKDVAESEFGATILRNGDNILAEKVIDRFENRLTIEGAVFFPGEYMLEEDMTLSALIEKAGGLREDYYPDRGLIIRMDDKLYPTIIPFSINDVMSVTQNPILQREDRIIIQDIFSIGEKKTVRVFGEVIHPGEYEFIKNMTLKDLIFLSGGMTEAASQSYIEIARRNTHEESQEVSPKLVSLYSFDISRDLKLDENDNLFALAPFDQIYIRKAPSYVAQKTVTIQGEVKYPGPYSISNKDERIYDLIERSGGMTPNAFPEGARLRRVVDKQIQQQFERIETFDKNLGDGVISAAEKIPEDEYFMLELRLVEIMKNPNSANNFLLKEGDEILIPVKTEEILVNGRVLNPAGLAWQKGKDLKYYIDRAGGFAVDAKKDKVYVVYSDGTTAITKNFIFRKYPQVLPGSQIVVPQKPERQKTDSGTWISIASTFASLALAVAVLFK
jgi:Periplasmic protein involved in polysaccharide export